MTICMGPKIVTILWYSLLRASITSNKVSNWHRVSLNWVGFCSPCSTSLWFLMPPVCVWVDPVYPAQQLIVRFYCLRWDYHGDWDFKEAKTKLVLRSVPTSKELSRNAQTTEISNAHPPTTVAPPNINIELPSQLNISHSIVKVHFYPVLIKWGLVR